MNEVRQTVKKAIKELFDVDMEPELSRPEERFGDFATNVAMQLAPKLSKKPIEVADALKAKIDELGYYQKVDIAGPGFLNITLKTDDIWAMAQNATNIQKPLAGQEILVEFGDPNPFKEMHIGHLYSYIVGDSISKLLESSGATVRQLSYHGDIGLHVAKAIYGLREFEKQRQEVDDNEAIEDEKFLGTAYAYGAKKYEEDDAAKAEIESLNLHIYKHDNPEINKLHEDGRRLSFSYFDKVLDLLGIKNDKRYLESQTTAPGRELVEKNVGSVFNQSQGAIIFEGEKVGLHTRVFITSKGLPTYETKDLGLVLLKDRDYPRAERSIVITANEQSEYFKVMLAALAEIDARLAAKTSHISHGFLSLASGKMSSRTGNVYPAMELLLEVKTAVHEQYPDSPVRKEVTFAAVKYAFLKHRLGSDIVFDIKESISLEGNSGPYLQYAHARASSILSKANVNGLPGDKVKFDKNERSLARKISEYPEIVEKSAGELMPHYVGTYLYELAQEFNRFYETSRIIGDERANVRIQLVSAYQKVLSSGLNILSISAPERM